MLRKSVLALVGALFILLGIVPYFLGSSAEKQFRALIAQPQLAELAIIDIVSYDRGWFSSDIEITITPTGFLEDYLATIGDAFNAEQMLALSKDSADGDDPAPPMENPLLAAFPYSEKIALHHGPVFIAGGPGVGLARISQEYDLLDFIEMMATLDDTGEAGASPSDIKLTAGSATMQSWTTIGFDGKIRSLTDAAGGTMQISSSTGTVTLEWSGAGGSSRIDLTDGSVDGNFETGSISLSINNKNDQNAEIKIAPLVIRMEGQYQNIWTFIGDFDVTWGGLSADTPNGGAFSFADISIKSSQTPTVGNAALIDSVGVMRIAEFNITKDADTEAILIGPIEMDMAFRNLDMIAYSEMNRASIDLPTAFVPGDKMDPEVAQELLTHVNKVLAGEPELEIGNFSLASSMGNVEMSLLIQVAPETAITANVADYIGGFSGNFSFAVDESMARTFARSTAETQFAALRPDNPPSEEELDAFTEQLLANYSNVGMLAKNDGRYSSEIELKDGKVLVNGQMIMDLTQMP